MDVSWVTGQVFGYAYMHRSVAFVEIIYLSLVSPHLSLLVVACWNINCE